MRVLALDYGDSRIGVAISDELGITAQPLKTIKNKNFSQVADEIKKLIEKYNVKEVIVGLPLHLNGGAGERAKITREFAEKLSDEICVPLFFQDERLSSAEVENVLLEADLSRQKRRQKRDKLAASLILRIYLDSGQGGEQI